MSDNDNDNNDAGASCGRSRRGPSRNKGRRIEALAKLKAAKDKKWKYEVEEEMTDNVYEVVDEKKYAERVKERLEEDFIVDDDGTYVEDGREIFDEDYDEEPGKFSGPRNARKKKRKAEEEEKKAKKRGNIKNMLLNMPEKKSNKEVGNKERGNLKEDEILESLLGDMRSTSSTSGGNGMASKTKSVGQSKTTSRSITNPFAKPRSTGLKQSITKIRVENSEKISTNSKLLDGLDEDLFEDMIEEVSEPMDISENQTLDDSATQNVEEFSEAELSSFMEDDFNEVEVDKELVDKKTVSHRGFLEDKEKKSKLDLISDDFNKGFNATKNEIVDVAIDNSSLPLIQNEQGDKVLRMYWLDAYEDPFKHPGTVWLFGKVFVESAKTYVSCCLTIKNIPRRVFFLKRDEFFDPNLKKPCNDGREVKMDDLENEFKTKIATKFKIGKFKAQSVEKLYAFEHADVPNKAEYLEVQYLPQFQSLPQDLHGETFSRVFGSNQSSLEHFLISRRMKGPNWLDIKCPAPNNPHTSWCKVEAVCEDPSFVSVVSNGPSPPPLTVLAINLQTTINPKTMLNEISLISCLVHNEVYLDKPAPKTLFQSYFCALTKPSDEVWPFDFQKVLANNKGAKIDKMESERALLGFFLAKIGKIDPDIIIGHDITGFDLDVLMNRILSNKIPYWSRMGRLKRSQQPNLRYKVSAEKLIATGRLVCDLKISAKELIRCKSYDLGALNEKLLGKAVENRIEIGCDEMRKAYESSKALLNVANLNLQDTSDTLKCLYELNALPLALQITQVAGNVLSRTLLGGRAERNEYLLLHAFHERNYIFPDKQFGKKKPPVHEDGADEPEGQNPGGKQGRRKPAYAGGLVLEPKKGFYDKFILLMDFNSLYPSIIQEYNICFTTVNRKLPVNENGHPDVDFIPELPGPECSAGVLPIEIKKLVESRKSVKKLLKDPSISAEQRMQYDIRQKALKLTANSMYGCLGFSHSRFFAKPLAALITSRGREILLNTKSLVEKMNLEVIYGDTDSIMVNSNSIDFDKVFKLGAQIKNEVNKMYKLLELDIDGVYRYMLLLKKKKYAAVTVEMRGDKLIETTELKGLDIVRRDWSQLAADAGKTVLSRILSDCSSDERISFLHEKLEQLADDLKNDKVTLADLAITKQLTKNPEDYADKKALPHVQVAVRINSKGGKKLKGGDTVSYVICEDGSNLPATQRAYHVDEVKERQDLKIDTMYYLAQQLHPVVSRLCDPLEGTDAARIAQCLGLDPDQYRRQVGSSGDRDEEREMREEDRFRECEKLQVTCVCGEEVRIDAVTRGLKDDRHLSLARCPSCRSPLIQNIVQLQNKLTMLIRNHLKKFHKGYVTCEDPACSGKTRQLPLQFRGAYPVCSTCHKAIMTKDFSDKQLYTQLLYYQDLFDVTKASTRFGKNFNTDLVPVKDGQMNYAKLKNVVDKTMKLNKFAIIDLTRLFSGFSTTKAAALRKGKNF